MENNIINESRKYGISIEQFFKKGVIALASEKKISTSDIPNVNKGINPKVFLIGLPLFIIQLVVVYFVTANILLSKLNVGTGAHGATTAPAPNVAKESAEEVEKKEVIAGGSIFDLGDIIVNPVGTNGQRLLLAAVGFDLPNEEEKKSCEEKKIILTDIVLSHLSSKNLEQLNSIEYRDTIKAEIQSAIKTRLQKIKINSIYFSKFIIQ
ncbi:MAG: flagellar basal body-associated FliL family protein [Ignavibacteria bacterium]